jgi:hypothetical protein
MGDASATVPLFAKNGIARTGLGEIGGLQPSNVNTFIIPHQSPRPPATSPPAYSGLEDCASPSVRLSVQGIARRALFLGSSADPFPGSLAPPGCSPPIPGASQHLAKVVSITIWLQGCNRADAQVGRGSLSSSWCCLVRICRSVCTLGEIWLTSITGESAVGKVCGSFFLLSAFWILICIT